jgi:D-tyrosyl-tRNA(Tyr) deacylase
MKALLQRVARASVTVAATGYRAEIGPGLLILLGVENGDGAAEIAWGADKCAELRIFADEAGNLNRSVKESGGEVLVVSQFTLAGDCRKGRRPSFAKAAPPGVAEPLYEAFCQKLRETHGLTVRQGAFGAMMAVELLNDGPVTVLVEKAAPAHARAEPDETPTGPSPNRR